MMKLLFQFFLISYITSCTRTRTFTTTDAFQICKSFSHCRPISIEISTYNRQEESKKKKSSKFITTCSSSRLSLLSSTQSEDEQNLDLDLPSAYDVSLPASLRGEAVRSALKSDRGTCLDFTSPSFANFNVGVVKVTGEKTANFLNSKLSTTFPERINSNSNSNSNNKGVNNNNVRIEYGQVKEAGLVTSKGKLIDKLTVLSFDTASTAKEGSLELESYLVTSPGHHGSMLFDRLDPFIFPLDGVKLFDMCPSSSLSSGSASGLASGASGSSTRVFTVVATKLENAQSSIQQNVLPILQKWGFNCPSLLFPATGGGASECLRYLATNSNNEKIELLLFEQTFLAPSCCSGYTIVVNEVGTSTSTSNSNSYSNSNFNVGSQIWANMVHEQNFNGPVELGPLEYETLRIEAGVPRFGKEITGAFKDKKGTRNSGKEEEKVQIFRANASPLELHLDHIVDETKGCYQGQEAIAAQLNNKRGLPRTLYSVIFPEEDNYYDDYMNDEEEYSNHGQRLANKTTKPRPGADLYVLGSNESIKVGTLTSVGEKDGTSSSETVALALVRRAEAILKKMDDLGLEIDVTSGRGEMNMFEGDPFWGDDGYSSLSDEGGIIQPPSKDPLDGLEVVLGGSFTQGYLRPIPSQRLQRGQNMFETELWQSMDDVQEETGSVMGFIPQDYEVPLENKSFEVDLQEEEEEEEEEEDSNAEEKAAEEEQQVSEAKRKEEKMKLLQQRAEEAMKRRREKKELEMQKAQSENENTSASSSGDEAMTAAETEAERKEAKMKLLKERAEAAMERRRQKKNESIN